MARIGIEAVVGRPGIRLGIKAVAGRLGIRLGIKAVVFRMARTGHGKLQKALEPVASTKHTGRGVATTTGPALETAEETTLHGTKKGTQR